MATVPGDDEDCVDRLIFEKEICIGSRGPKPELALRVDS